MLADILLWIQELLLDIVRWVVDFVTGKGELRHYISPINAILMVFCFGLALRRSLFKTRWVNTLFFSFLAGFIGALLSYLQDRDLRLALVAFFLLFGAAFIILNMLFNKQEKRHTKGAAANQQKHPVPPC